MLDVGLFDEAVQIIDEVGLLLSPVKVVSGQTQRAKAHRVCLALIYFVY